MPTKGLYEMIPVRPSPAGHLEGDLRKVAPSDQEWARAQRALQRILLREEVEDDHQDLASRRHHYYKGEHLRTLLRRRRRQSIPGGLGITGKMGSKRRRQAEKALAAAVQDLRPRPQALPQLAYRTFLPFLRCLLYPRPHRFHQFHLCPYQHTNLHHAAI